MQANFTHSPDTPQLAYLRVLSARAVAGQFLEIRWRTRGGPMRRRFIPARQTETAARLVGVLAPRNDVYVGVALRDERGHGGRGAISGLHVAYVDCDARSAPRVTSFAHRPSMLIASGTPGHVQAYWLLDRRYPPAEVEACNRRLARALSGDPACTDGARILRPPGTLNHKHRPPRLVTLLALREHARYTLAELTHGLPDDPTPRSSRSSAAPPRRGRTPLDRQLFAIPAAEYVRVLTGLTPNREGKLACPFHTDRDPSLQLYPDGGFYCFGSGCNAGGTIFDFAGRLWGIPTRGSGFIELRERLAQHFHLTAQDCSVSQESEAAATAGVSCPRGSSAPPKASRPAVDGASSPALRVAGGVP